MRVFGIELSGGDANIVLMVMEKGVFDLPDCRVRKLQLKKDASTDDVRAFQATFRKLAEDYSVRHVFIKERPISGKFSGSAAGFKMEAAIQLIDALTVTTLAPAAIKEGLSHNPLTIQFRDTGLKGFQESAFITGYVGCFSTQEKPAVTAKDIWG